jgi:hypothetical protein
MTSTTRLGRLRAAQFARAERTRPRVRAEARRAGFRSIGMQCYVPRAGEGNVSLMERRC